MSDESAGVNKATTETQHSRFSELLALRQSPSVGRVAAFRQLYLKLVALTQLYGEAIDKGNLEQQRIAVFNAIAALIEYLTSQGLSLSVLQPMTRIQRALVNREKNLPDPLFADRAREGRPASTPDHHRRIGLLAALANAWLNAHEADAGRFAEKLSQAARELSGPCFGEVTASELQGARKTASEEASDHLAVDHFRRWNMVLRARAAETGIKQAFQDILARLNEDPHISAVAGYRKK